MSMAHSLSSFVSLNYVSENPKIVLSLKVLISCLRSKRSLAKLLQLRCSTFKLLL